MDAKRELYHQAISPALKTVFKKKLTKVKKTQSCKHIKNQLLRGLAVTNGDGQEEIKSGCCLISYADKSSLGKGTCCQVTSVTIKVTSVIAHTYYPSTEQVKKKEESLGVH